jgi:VanZ family protein
LQIPVNRHADARDFAADMVGAFCGTLVFLGVRRWLPRLWE